MLVSLHIISCFHVLLCFFNKASQTSWCGKFLLKHKAFLPIKLASWNLMIFLVRQILMDTVFWAKLNLWSLCCFSYKTDLFCGCGLWSLVTQDRATSTDGKFKSKWPESVLVHGLLYLVGYRILPSKHNAFVVWGCIVPVWQATVSHWYVCIFEILW